MGQVLLGISSKDLSSYHSKEQNKPVHKSNKIPTNNKEFIAFALLSEVNNIDPRFRDNLSFRLCIGKNYNFNILL